ncbi:MULTISPECIES: sulfite exporter TauE/SafE family protein [unclassified Pseudomonas]|uniref:sulfite exporter TauE/SafE family protein n=1 Tax=unclassified Pseudomonas TaxID=196821 RepID=UPI00244BD402|nr:MULTISPECIES: sulfite exporter TauE/SafE family protein [unclassified Pseudomonas]MDG9923891.1 sulfite exporter TauE/SafE family protein [Pseudomonas sp. GD04045]MDH0035122.1 sulfite exporter TauE/SafE family protein [Pseudomonas sp. GD04019]
MIASYALGAFILLAYTLEAVTGFGSIVIALSLGALLLPIEQLLPVLVPLNIGMTGYLVWRHRAQIDRRLLLGTILPGMVVGTALGYLLLPYLDAALLKRGFGVLILWFAGRELWRLRHAAALPVRPQWLTRLLTLGAGISHGLFASGGPLLVYGLAGTTLDKARFRATLVSVWFTLNSLLTAAFLVDGRLQPALPQVLAYAPLLLVGLWLGERLHQRFDERHFRIAIYALLLVTGTLLLAPWSLV